MADSRVRISVDALSQEIAEMNNCLEKRRDGAQACIKAVEAYCGETNLTGEAYSNSKDYFNVTHIPLLKQIVYLCGEIIDVNNSILPKFSQYVPDTRGFDADTSVLEEEIRRLKAENSNFIARIEDQRLSSRPTPLSNYNLGLQGWYDGQITINNHIIDELQKIVDGMRAFNSQCAGIYGEINALLDQLKAGIQQLNSQSVWNSEAKRFVISTEMLTKLAEIEYEKMIIHNPDGSIGLDRGYVSRVLQQEALQGSPAEIEATYLALIKTFATLAEKDDLEYYLNACYIKRGIVEPDNQIPVPHTFECTLSSVFLEAVKYYNANEVPALVNSVIEGNTVYDKNEETHILARFGVLQDLACYGNKTYIWDLNDKKVFHPITVDVMDDDKYKVNIQSTALPSVTACDFVQYRYSTSLRNVYVGGDIAIDNIRRIRPTLAEYAAGEGLGFIPAICPPKISGGAYALMFFVGAAEAVDGQSDADNAENAITYTEAMSVFGLDGELYTVKGELYCRYLHLDKQKFLQNFAAFKVECGYPNLTIDELCNSPDTTEKFIKFGTVDIPKGAVQSVVDNNVYNGDVNKLINDKVDSADIAKLDASIEEWPQMISEVQYD